MRIADGDGALIPCMRRRGTSQPRGGVLAQGGPLACSSIPDHRLRYSEDVRIVDASPVVFPCGLCVMRQG